MSYIRKHQNFTPNDVLLTDTISKHNSPQLYNGSLSHNSSNEAFARNEYPKAKSIKLPGPLPLKSRYLSTSGIFVGLFDALTAILMLCFVIFGALVYSVDGQPTGAGSDKVKLLQEVARYGPTIFPLAFAAVVGRSMHAFATWKLQKGTTIGLIEQLLGSTSISGAFLTQISLQTFNFLALGIIVIWCLSPLGSQASLRVIYLDTQYLSNATTLMALNPYAPYYKYSSFSMSPPLIAALTSFNVLTTRTQDLWGNIRVPQLNQSEGFEDSSWQLFPNISNMTYSALVGLPFSAIPSSVNTTTTFIMSTSYLNLSCPIFEQGIIESSYTNYNSDPPPAPLGATDCSWTTGNGSAGFRMALSLPCVPIPATRDARTLVFEWLNMNTLDGLPAPRLHAECQLYTTYVDYNVSCLETTCSAIAARLSPNSPTDLNWTAFDEPLRSKTFTSYDQNHTLGTQNFHNDFLDNFSGDSLELGEEMNPILQYLIDPEKIYTLSTGVTYNLSQSTFETRLGQLLNSQYLVGLSPLNITSGTLKIDDDAYQLENKTTINATTTIPRQIVRCNKVWLAALIACSMVCFLVGIAGSLFRTFTLVPDVLSTTIPLAMLDNRCQGVSFGGTTLSGDDKVITLKKIRVKLGDVDPLAEVGNIALAGPTDDFLVNEVRRERLYK